MGFLAPWQVSDRYEEIDVSGGKRLRSAREAAGMTQAEVAKKLGVSESFIRLYELGKRQPSDEMLGSVRDVLEILFRLEDACGFIPLEDGKLDVDRMYGRAPKLVASIERWTDMRRWLKDGEIVRSEYDAWRSRV